MEFPSEVLQKNVYLIWNNSNLGDLINGTITTFKICKLNNYNLIIDMSNSNISHFLRNGKSPLCISPYINFQTNAYNIENVPFFKMNEKINLEYYIHNFFIEDPSYNVCYISTSAFPFEEIKEDEKQLIKDLLFPNDLIYNLIEYQYSALPPFLLEPSESENKILKKYASVYYNIGDEKGIKDDVRYDKFLFYLNRLTTSLHLLDEKAIVLFSDSYEFKKFAETENRNLSFTNNKLNNEICDFYLMSKSKSITFLYEKMLYEKEHLNYMPYCHFAYLCSNIYDIPIHTIKIDN
jgi:hypothetical protein